MSKKDEERKGAKADFNNRMDADKSGRVEEVATRQAATYRHKYDGLAPRLTISIDVTALTPTGENTKRADGIWDTGATNTVINKPLADRLGIVPAPPAADELEPMTMTETRYEGRATVRLRIGDVVTPFFHAKVSDLDPDGRKAAMGYEVPEFLIGMDVIASGLLIVDSMGDDTVLRFTMA